jgi:hypothetical protein
MERATMSFSCCGKTPGRKLNRAPAEKLPDNPRVNGVRIIYLGSGRKDVKGAVSGLTYYVADHRRHFRADPEDAKALLRSRDFILQI